MQKRSDQQGSVFFQPKIRLFKLLHSGSRAAQSELAMGHSCLIQIGRQMANIGRLFALELWHHPRPSGPEPVTEQMGSMRCVLF